VHKASNEKETGGVGIGEPESSGWGPGISLVMRKATHCQKIHPEGSGAAGESISKSDSVSDGCWCLFMCLVPCDKSLTLMPADGWGEKDPPSLTHLDPHLGSVARADTIGGIYLTVPNL